MRPTVLTVLSSTLVLSLFGQVVLAALGRLVYCPVNAAEPRALLPTIAVSRKRRKSNPALIVFGKREIRYPET